MKKNFFIALLFLVLTSISCEVDNTKIDPFYNDVVKKLSDAIEYEIKGKNLSQLIWHIGNRHIPCDIQKDKIFILYDQTIKNMVIKLGGKVKKVFKAFKPEGGAYGIGRTYSHKH